MSISKEIKKHLAETDHVTDGLSGWMADRLGKGLHMDYTNPNRSGLEKIAANKTTIRFYLEDEEQDFARAVTATHEGTSMPPENLPPELLARLTKRGDVKLVDGRLMVSVNPHVGWSVHLNGRRTVGIPGLHGHVTITGRI